MLKPLLHDIFDDQLSMEGKLYKNSTKLSSVYILLTDTKTRFSKLSAHITKEQYNHCSIMLDRSFDRIYTYALTTENNGYKGGFKLENKAILNGSNYQLYEVKVPERVMGNIHVYLQKKIAEPTGTRYNHKSLLNFILRRDVFKSRNLTTMICSEFVYMILKESGYDLFKDDEIRSIKPTDLIKGHGVKFLEEGVIDDSVSIESDPIMVSFI